MGAHLFGYACSHGCLLNDLPETNTAHGLAPIGYEQVWALLALEQERTAAFQIGHQHGCGVAGKGDNPFLVTFALNTKMPTGQVAGAKRQANQLGNPQAGRIEQVEHGMVTQAKGSVLSGTVEQAVHLGWCQGLGHLYASFRGIKKGERILLYLSLQEKEIAKGAQCGQSTGKRTGAQAAFVAML